MIHFFLRLRHPDVYWKRLLDWLAIHGWMVGWTGKGKGGKESEAGEEGRTIYDIATRHTLTVS
jgi:hypothetical protein